MRPADILTRALEEQVRTGLARDLEKKSSSKPAPLRVGPLATLLGTAKHHYTVRTPIIGSRVDVYLGEQGAAVLPHSVEDHESAQLIYSKLQENANGQLNVTLHQNVYGSSARWG
jgi:hypothetical protein